MGRFENDNPWIGARARDSEGIIITTIIHHNDLVDVLGDGGQYASDEAFFVERGNDDVDQMILVHGGLSDY